MARIVDIKGDCYAVSGPEMDGDGRGDLHVLFQKQDGSDAEHHCDNDGNGWACDCKGWQYRGYCRHVQWLQSEEAAALEPTPAQVQEMLAEYEEAVPF